MKNISPESSGTKHKNGIIVGRFQPFHLEHLRYAVAAAKEVEHLWIGITRPFGNLIQESGGERTADHSNPLPYWLRLKCIERALLDDASIPRNKFSIIPLPLHCEVIKDIVPEETIFMTTIIEQWNIQKEELFLKAGFKVLRLDLGNKAISGTIIREKIKQGDMTWKNYLPTSIRDQYSFLIASYVLREVAIKH